MTNKAKNLVFLYYILDLILLSVSFFIMKYIKYESDWSPEYIFSIYFMLMITWIVILLVNDSGKLYLRESYFVRLRSQIINFLVYTGIIAVIIFSFQLGYFSRLQTFGTIAIFFILKTLVFYFLYLWIWQRRKKGRHLAKVLVAGAGRVGCRFYVFTQKHPYLGFKVVGFLDDCIEDKACDIQNMILGRVEEIPEVLEKYDIDEVVIAIPLTAEASINTIINIADYHGKRIKMIPDFYRILNRNHHVTSIGEFPIINIREIPLDHLHNMLIKRIYDLIVSILGIVVSLPVMIILAILIKIESKGPLFYRPLRLSKGGEQFRMLKYRSMYNDDSLDKGNISTVVNDPRITRIGRWMRKFNLDELPQLFNVLINNMSIVGPRPHRVLLNYDMQHAVSGYMIRHYIKPGITGWAQVNGWRGPTVTIEQKNQRTKYDLWYIENWTFWLDIKIMWLTVFSIKARKNAF
jgi:Undecaprenyl-phosphate glucose phosphotransferase